jgi:hypothetical protein
MVNRAVRPDGGLFRGPFGARPDLGAAVSVRGRLGAGLRPGPAWCGAQSRAGSVQGRLSPGPAQSRAGSVQGRLPGARRSPGARRIPSAVVGQRRAARLAPARPRDHRHFLGNIRILGNRGDIPGTQTHPKNGMRREIGTKYHESQSSVATMAQGPRLDPRARRLLVLSPERSVDPSPRHRQGGGAAAGGGARAPAPAARSEPRPPAVLPARGPAGWTPRASPAQLAVVRGPKQKQMDRRPATTRPEPAAVMDRRRATAPPDSAARGWETSPGRTPTSPRGAATTRRGAAGLTAVPTGERP